MSVDDHVVEPADLWVTRLPAKFVDRAPQVHRKKLDVTKIGLQDSGFEFSDAGQWADVWHYEDVQVPNILAAACAGWEKRDIGLEPILFEEMRPGCFRADERLKDMDVNGVKASLCFPNMFVRFCGQRFLEASDKEVALLCLRAYNDFVVEEWCSGSGGRLVPLCIVPLWDVELARGEIVRNAARGVRAVTFPELPTQLGLPSIHSGHWEPLFQACEQTDTVIHLHIGSGSTAFGTSDDAPEGVGTLLSFVTPAMGLADWLLSGIFVRHPQLTVALAESNLGWISHVLERADTRWVDGRKYQPVWDMFAREPSSYFASNMHVSFFNDRAGLAYIDAVGTVNNFGFDNISFETDYPHQDGTWPHSSDVAERLMEGLEPAVQRKLVSDNAMRLLRLTTAA